ncbi:MAG TPA: DNA-3-methyladenine glycosylase 2 family protein, partial [Anaerolineae bacterium]|nr:DNA-3-methyladenine glycosylase 2 family protein [Anaerolineae bacterium]
MNLTHAQCYEIVKSRDARFDGRFFTAVKTTGIYCRPICPARRPLAKNVQFYATAAAAAKAGFRPCLRCRPESSPGMEDWLDRSELVSRAVRLIDEGVFDASGATGLASHLHISPRQLQRLFGQHLGASPVAVAQTRRALFARKLIKETNLPMTEIAFSAGYKSVRRFNAAILATYGNSPREFRKFLENPSKRGHTSTIQLSLSYRPPYDWEACLQFMAARAIPSVESVEGRQYRRTIAVDGKLGVLEIRPNPPKNSLQLTLPIQLASALLTIVEKVRRLFDLRAAPLKINAHLQQDLRLTEQIDLRSGLRVVGAWDGFECAVLAILCQQNDLPTATHLAGQLAQTFGTALGDVEPTELSFVFPEAGRLISADLSKIGISQQNAAAIQALAQRVADGRIQWNTHADLDKAIEKLTAISGISMGAAQQIAMHALNEPDAFSAENITLRRMMTPADSP